MKITAIKQQVKRQGRYSIFTEGKYAFSLGESALLDQRLTIGQELTPKELRELKKLSEDDKIYNTTLNYLAIRKRSKWELETYLQRKGASPSLASIILNKLSNSGYIDDMSFATSYIRDKRLLRPTSRRKLVLELRKKHVSVEDIERALVEAGDEDESTALLELIERKRRRSRYQDDLKLMQYLVRQGFDYGDVKAALADS